MSVRIAVHVNLLDTFDREFLMLECDLVGFRCELLGVLYDSLWKRGGEQHYLNSFWEQPGRSQLDNLNTVPLVLTFSRGCIDLPFPADQACCLPHQAQALSSWLHQSAFSVS